jgi:hypothetical protein
MSVINDEAPSILDGLHERRQAALLTRFAHNLTVSARDAYGLQAEGSEQLRRYNEIQHVVTARVWALLKEDEPRYPSQGLFGAIVEKAGDDAAGLRLRERLEWAFSLALRQEHLPRAPGLQSRREPG